MIDVIEGEYEAAPAAIYRYRSRTPARPRSAGAGGPALSRSTTVTGRLRTDTAPGWPSGRGVPWTAPRGWHARR